jgi:hypothetical protein
MSLNLLPNPLDYSRRAGTCPCGQIGRLYLLRGRLVCSSCYAGAEMEVAKEVELTWQAEKGQRGR